LHSHSLTWGSGSHQQSITAVQNHDDPNSLWMIKEGHKETPCETGTPILCNQTIRLEHVNTRKNLHSHEYASFITDSQEVRNFF
jgi:dolichyl-phosphate-mannose--protein O-mannosyl transferase